MKRTSMLLLLVVVAELWSELGVSEDGLGGVNLWGAVGGAAMFQLWQSIDSATRFV